MSPEGGDPEPDPDEPDFVLEDGLMVATRSGLLRRGTCCGLGCRHCPWPSEGGATGSPSA